LELGGEGRRGITLKRREIMRRNRGRKNTSGKVKGEEGKEKGGLPWREGANIHRLHRRKEKERTREGGKYLGGEGEGRKERRREDYLGEKAYDIP
jgi:hypothetical protein